MGESQPTRPDPTVPEGADPEVFKAKEEYEAEEEKKPRTLVELFKSIIDEDQLRRSARETWRHEAREWAVWAFVMVATVAGVFGLISLLWTVIDILAGLRGTQL